MHRLRRRQRAAGDLRPSVLRQALARRLHGRSSEPFGSGKPRGCTKRRDAARFATQLSPWRSVSRRHLSLCQNRLAPRTRMDFERFDRWTRQMSGRRPALGVLVGGLLGVAAGLPSATDARKKKKKKKRCRGTGQACRPGLKCCSGRHCTEGRCCDNARVFVRCPNECLCAGNTQFCCVGAAGSSQEPFCQDASVAPEECCPLENVCGDLCCDPLSVCVEGACECRPENQCPNACCDLSDLDCACIEETGVCGPGCPSGGGSFLRVRRVR